MSLCIIFSSHSVVIVGIVVVVDDVVPNIFLTFLYNTNTHTIYVFEDHSYAL